MTPKSTFKFEQSALKVAITLAIIAAVQMPAVYQSLPRGWQHSILDMRTSRLSARDQAELERGYYENLTAAKPTDGLFDLQIMDTHRSLPVNERHIFRQTGDDFLFELIPDQITVFEDAVFSTNSAGMRDKDYSLKKPYDTTRIALLGASRAMGWGVGDDETFEALTEDSLNAQLDRPVELLNFAVADYEPLRRLLTLTEKAAAYDPDIALFVAHDTDIRVRKLAQHVAMGKSLDFAIPEINAAIKAAGVTSRMSYEVVRDRLTPYRSDILQGIYREFVREAQNLKAKPVWVYLPSVEDNAGQGDEIAEMERLAKTAGFDTIRLTGNLGDSPAQNYWLSPTDRHPNAQAHRLIAEELVDHLLRPETRAAVGLGKRQ